MVQQISFYSGNHVAKTILQQVDCKEFRLSLVLELELNYYQYFSWVEVPANLQFLPENFKPQKFSFVSPFVLVF